MKKVDKEKLTDEQRQKRNYKMRVRIVAIISVIAAIALFISYRGNFLEMQELGGDYLSVFWRNTIYSLVLFVINFLIIYFAFYFTNKKIKKTLKVFFCNSVPFPKSFILILSVNFLTIDFGNSNEINVLQIS